MYTRNVKENIMQEINMSGVQFTEPAAPHMLLSFLPGAGLCDLNCIEWMKGWELGLWTKSILTVEARWTQNSYPLSHWPKCHGQRLASPHKKHLLSVCVCVCVCVCACLQYVCLMASQFPLISALAAQDWSESSTSHPTPAYIQKKNDINIFF